MKETLTILFLGANGGNALKRANALRRLGHDVTLIDPSSLFPFRKFVGKLIYYGGGSLIESYLKKRITPIIDKRGFDATFVDNVEFVGSNIMSLLRRVSTIIINYNNDDPFGTRDKKKWRLYLEAVPLYDLLAVVRPVNVAEAYALGARKVLQVFMAVEAYRLLAREIEQPLHLGITEAGGLRGGTVKSAVGLGMLLMDGIGDTIRVSLTRDPVEEIRAGFEILKAVNVRHVGPDIISCPTCGRCGIDLFSIVEQVERHALTMRAPVKIAVMAGIDMSMVPLDFSFYDLLVELVKEGEVPVWRIDEAVGAVDTSELQKRLAGQLRAAWDAGQAMQKSAAPQSAHPEGPRDDRAEVPAEGVGRALRHRGSPGARPEEIRPRGSGRGASRIEVGEALPAGAPAPSFTRDTASTPAPRWRSALRAFSPTTPMRTAIRSRPCSSRVPRTAR